MKPILFSTPMVEAILNGRKTQTRRILKGELPWPQGEFPARWRLTYYSSPIVGYRNRYVLSDGVGRVIEVNPEFKLGDILWVREAWNGFESNNVPYVYRATDLKSCGHDWKPSIHMPFNASRIFLKVKNIKVEKLNDISEKDAISEGICNHIDDDGIHQFYIYPVKEKRVSRITLGVALLCDTYISKGIFGLEEPAKFSFHSLWESIYGMQSWDLNPWVWVYEFERINTQYGQCFICGCIDSDCSQCIEKTGKPCGWANAAHTVCTACKPNLKKK